MKRVLSIIVAVAAICGLTMCSSEKRKQEKPKDVAEQAAADVPELQKLAEAGNAKGAQAMIQLSGVVRLVVMGVALLAGIKLGANVIALALPLLFLRPVLMLAEFFRKKGDP